MELRHLRYFEAVARERGFGRAATALNVAQPALSRQIKDLEDEVGVALFERTPKGVEITPAGEMFGAGVTRIMAAVTDALAAARRAADGQEGRCRLGMGRLMLSMQSMLDALQQLRVALPGAEIVIEEVNVFDQAAMLLTGDIDVGIAIPPGDARIESELFQLNQFSCAGLALDHRLAGRAIIEPDELQDEPCAFLSPQRAPELGVLMGRALDRAGIRSPREFIYSTPQSATMMVASGRGWAPASIELIGRNTPGIVVIPVRGLDLPFRVDLIWRRNESRKVVRAALDILRGVRDGKVRPHDPVSAPLAATSVPPGLELRHFRYFAAVADDEGFGRAADRLEVTQSSLSRQVADLEHHVGTELFQRTARGVLPTDAGRALRRSVNRVLDEVDTTMGAARQASRGLVGRCVIASVSTGAASRIVAATARVCAERYPGVTLVFEEYLTPQQPDALRDGLVDAGICHSLMLLTDDPQLAHQRLIEDRVDCILVSEEHPLAGRERITAAELEGHPFLFMDRAFSPPMYDRVHTALGNLGLRPRANEGYNSLHLIWMLCGQGSGWALNFGVPRHRPPEGLVAIEVEGLELTFGLDLLWRRNEGNPIVAKVLEVMREAAVPRETARDSKRQRETANNS